MGWIDLAQDRDQWRALVDTVTNHRVDWDAGNVCSSGATVSFSAPWS
jgi:hypothetical protein